MAEIRKYGEATTIEGVPIIKAGEQDFAVAADWTPAAGDVKVSKDGTAANIGTLPTYVADEGWKFTLTAAEMQGKQIGILIVDQDATKVIEDQKVRIETIGHPSAQHGSGPPGSIQTTISALTSQTVFEVADGPPDNNTLDDWAVVIEDASTALQMAAGVVDSYVGGASKEVTLRRGSGIFTMAVGDLVTLVPPQVADALGPHGYNILLSVPRIVEKPNSGTLTYSFRLHIRGPKGAMVDAVSAPTVNTLRNIAGTDLSARLDSTTSTKLADGIYEWVYTSTSTDNTEGIEMEVFVNIGGQVTNIFAHMVVQGVGSLEATTQAVLDDTAEIGTAGAGLTAVPWNAAWDAEVQSEAADALVAYDPPTKAELDVLGTSALATQASVNTIDTNVDTLLTRITSSLFTGITSLAEWLGLMAGKQTADATALAEIKTTGAGSGTYDEATDSQEAIRDRGDAAWAGTGATAGEIADAVWDEATSGHATAGTFGAALSDILVDTDTTIPGLIAALNDPSAATIADAIWDEAQADHVTAGSFGEIATEIASILADTNELQADDVPGLIAALNNVSAADVNAQLVDVLSTDVQALPGQGAPTATPTMVTALMYLYKAWRNKSDQTSTLYQLYDDAGTTVDQKRTIADDGTTFDAEEIETGP